MDIGIVLPNPHTMLRKKTFILHLMSKENFLCLSYFSAVLACGKQNSESDSSCVVNWILNAQIYYQIYNINVHCLNASEFTALSQMHLAFMTE